MYMTFGTGVTVESKGKCGNKNDPQVLSLAYWWQKEEEMCEVRNNTFSF